MLRAFRKVHIESMMRSALAINPIQNLCPLRKVNVSSCIFISLIVMVSVVTLSSYIFSSFTAREAFSSYKVLLTSLPSIMLLCCTSSRMPNKEDSGGHNNHSQLKDWVEDLGGNGPRVVAYLRVSTGRQAKEGFSLEAQQEQLDKLKSERKPSKIYWFTEAGKAGVDFDKRKINKIIE